MDRIIVVTGGAGGLGLEIVRKHLTLGDRVWSLGRHETEEIKELERIQADGFVRFLNCDVSSTSNVQEAIRKIRKEISGPGNTASLDILYSCAGIHRQEDFVPLAQTDLDAALPVIDVNAVGFLRVVKELLPVMDGRTTILCVTSIDGSIERNRRTSQYSYSMSKCAENMACAILQRSFDESVPGARAVCVHPGWLRTRMGGPNAELDPSDCAADLIRIAEHMDKVPREHPFIDRMGHPIPW